MLEQNGIDISWGAQEMMESADFITLKSREVINLVYLNISDLGLVEDPTTDQIYERAQELGLELCPPEVGPELRFKYTNQPLGEWKYIAMKQISGSHVQPGMFALECNGDGRLRLLSVWTPPDSPWYSDHGLVFRLRK
jgi:hypothetical protein